MNANLDLSRWRETPLGLNHRRWTIVTTGVRALVRTRFFRVLISIAWMAGGLVALAGFAFAQSLSDDGWLALIASKLGPRMEALHHAFGALVLLYPDVCLNALFTTLFWIHSFVGLWLSLIALTVMVPSLITRDRNTNALLVYLARPLTSTDYLLGKLGIIVSLLLVLWTGPLLLGWLLSMLFATNRDFIVYSFSPLLRALAFNGIAVVSLAAIALGVSSLGRLARVTVSVWIGLWLVLGFLAATRGAPEWIQRASFTQNLSEIRKEVFRLDAALTAAGAELPIVDQRLAGNIEAMGKSAETKSTTAAAVSLGVFVALSSVAFFRKLRPE